MFYKIPIQGFAIVQNASTKEEALERFQYDDVEFEQRVDPELSEIDEYPGNPVYSSSFEFMGSDEFM